MYIPFYLLLIGAWATLALWLVGAFFTLRGIMRQRPLQPVGVVDIGGLSAPFVSVLVPARNEAGRVLAASISSMLTQDYASFEVIVTNDRSTDATEDILREIEKRNHKLCVLNGTDLPAGWLGKPYAMHQAYKAAKGEWLLATDADVIFDPRAMRTAIHHALAGGYDAVSLIPHIECLTFWERVFMPNFGWFMFISRPIERVNDRRRSDALGIGGFFLIHRQWLERVGGWQSVCDEVAEDLRLAEMLKGAGAHLRVEYAPTLVRTRMQTNFREIWEGFTKNLFAGAQFRVWSALFGGFAVLLFSVMPVLLLAMCLTLIAASGGSVWIALALPLLIVWAVQILVFMVVNRACGVPMMYALLMPLGHLMFVLILFNSAIKILSGRGVTWKGRVLYDRTGVRPPRQATRRAASSSISND